MNKTVQKTVLSMMIATAIFAYFHERKTSIDPAEENKITDFKASLETQKTALATPEKVKSLVQVSTRIIRRIGACIKKDLCGERASPGRAYFNPENTDSNRKLNRALRFTLAMEGRAFVSELPEKGDVLPLVSVINDETPILATEIILAQNLATCAEILEETGKGSGPSQAIVYGILLKSNCERRQVLNGLTKSVETADPATVQGLAEKLRDDHLSQSEFLALAPSFCRMKANLNNWKALKSSLQLAIESGGFEVNLSQLCAD